MLQVRIARSERGYGFSVRNGTCPVQVGRVNASGAARQAGLVSGDILVTVNGQDVLACAADTVARCIRYVSMTTGIIISSTARFTLRLRSTV